MKTQYDFINFVKIEDKPKTSVWSCRNNHGGYELGQVKWYPAWRQYCFMFHDNTVFNIGCLKDIIDFIGQLK